MVYVDRTAANQIMVDGISIQHSKGNDNITDENLENTHV